MSGHLYLVPNLLGVVEPERVLPVHTIEVARTLRHWLVESRKPARAYLKLLAASRPIAELSIESIAGDGNAPSMQRLLAPALRGEHVGLLSDAGCPGVADPGASVVAAAHALGVHVVPLVGPSSLLLALMASGLNGQRFAFHGYLPVKAEDRAAALQRLEADSRAQRCTQMFIETPYRNVAMLTTILVTLAPSTRLCVAADLTLRSESVLTRRVHEWRDSDLTPYAKRPAIFLVDVV